MSSRFMEYDRTWTVQAGRFPMSPLFSGFYRARNEQQPTALSSLVHVHEHILFV